MDNYCRGNAVVGNSCCDNPNNGIFEKANAGNDYSAILANVCAGNSDRDNGDNDQIDYNGANSFEEHNIKKYLL